MVRERYIYRETEIFLSWGRSRERRETKKKSQILGEVFELLGCSVSFSPLRKVSPFPCLESFFFFSSSLKCMV